MSDDDRKRYDDFVKDLNRVTDREIEEAERRRKQETSAKPVYCATCGADVSIAKIFYHIDNVVRCADCTYSAPKADKLTARQREVIDAMTDIIRIVVASERDRCAKVAEDWAMKHPGVNHLSAGIRIAKAIREPAVSPTPCRKERRDG